MKFLIAFVAAIAVVSADPELDAMEKSANDVLTRIHTHLGGSGDNSLNNFLTNSDFIKDAAEQLNRTRRDRIEEGIGSLGATFVSITRGKKQVNVTTVYGVGAGAIVNVRDRQRTQVEGEVDEPSQQEVDEVTQPLFEKYVNKIVNEEAGKDSTIVHLGDEGRREFKLRNSRDELRARARGGFRVGAKTTVSRRG